MSSIAPALPVPVAPPDVVAFAEKHVASAYLPAVLAMTRWIFPTWPIKVFLEEDAEIADLWQIIIEVQIIKEADAETLFNLDQRWVRELFEHCPSTHVCLFCLGMA